MGEFYHGNREVSLRKLNLSDLDSLLDFNLRNREFFAPWEPSRQEEFYTRAYQLKLLEDELGLVRSGTLLKLGIFLEEENKLIGTISYSNIVRGVFLSCNLGYKLDQGYKGQGYMYQALEKSIDIVFKQLGLHRIEANIRPENERSLRLIKALNFIDEGLSSKYLKIYGEWKDHRRFVLFNQELEDRLEIEN